MSKELYTFITKRDKYNVKVLKEIREKINSHLTFFVNDSIWKQNEPIKYFCFKNDGLKLPDIEIKQSTQSSILKTNCYVDTIYPDLIGIITKGDKLISNNQDIVKTRLNFIKNHLEHCLHDIMKKIFERNIKIDPSFKKQIKYYKENAFKIEKISKKKFNLEFLN